MAECVYNRPNSKLIVSSYVNGGKPSPEKLGNLIACMQSTGADVIKLVINVEYITDLASVFKILAHCQVATSPIQLLKKKKIIKFHSELLYIFRLPAGSIDCSCSGQ